VAGDVTALAGRRERGLRGLGHRKLLLVAAFVAVFLTVGVPRFLAGDHGPANAPSQAGFTKLCRAHGGTPHTTPGSGPTTLAQRFCTVQYGGTTYRMDAITPSGFDQDTASFQRQGCEQAQGAASRRGAFVYHPETGVCEHRP
jgi:hypothetical protein